MSRRPRVIIEDVEDDSQGTSRQQRPFQPQNDAKRAGSEKTSRLAPLWRNRAPNACSHQNALTAVKISGNDTIHDAGFWLAVDAAAAIVASTDAAPPAPPQQQQQVNAANNKKKQNKNYKNRRGNNSNAPPPQTNLNAKADMMNAQFLNVEQWLNRSAAGATAKKILFEQQQQQQQQQQLNAGEKHGSAAALERRAVMAVDAMTRAALLGAAAMLI